MTSARRKATSANADVVLAAGRMQEPSWCKRTCIYFCLVLRYSVVGASGVTGRFCCGRYVLRAVRVAGGTCYGRYVLWAILVLQVGPNKQEETQSVGHTLLPIQTMPSIVCIKALDASIGKPAHNSPQSSI